MHKTSILEAINGPKPIIFVLLVVLIVSGCSDKSTELPTGFDTNPTPPDTTRTFTLATVPDTFAPTDNIWIITDNGSAATTVDFNDLRDALIEAEGRKIKLEFPDIETIPDEALYFLNTEITSLVSGSASKVTIIGEDAFRDYIALATVDFPIATTIEGSAFSEYALL